MNRRTVAGIVGASVAGMALAGAMAGIATASTPSTTALSATAKEGFHAMPTSYSAGKYSIEQLITNNTDQTWTFDPSDSTIDCMDGHWGERPLAILAPGETEEVTAYTPDYAGIKMYVTYTLPNGGFVAADAVNPLVGSNGWDFDGVYTQAPNDAEVGAPPIEAGYTTTAHAGSGVHMVTSFAVTNATS